ncbi:MAG: 50S ribosomal protein L9 [Bacteroidaceae bacterium]|nr:50S ribosomal protein L9 [Candidatus Minthousia equi]MCQ2246905.1 50S ribosomal protein L9 [Bacteroidaceae bacterium]MDO4955501.1 50S ribosomal protein L9 [Bacteroidales bacterium]
MEIILKKDVVGLGFADDIVTVKNGYGRNYLIPQGMAIVASPAAKKMLAEELKQRAHKLAKIKADAEALAEKINAVSLTIPVKVSAAGAVYGSVNNIQLAEGLAKEGIEIERKIIVLKDVKALGDFEAAVKLHRDVTATLKFTVVPEEA